MTKTQSVLRRCGPSRNLRCFPDRDRCIKRRCFSNAVDVEGLRSRRLPVLFATLAPDANKLLDTSINDFLPRPKDDWMMIRTSTYLRPGHHLAYFYDTSPTQNLMDDGTDATHAPDRSWKYRVWAGGSLRFPSPRPILLDNSRAAVVEKIENVRVVGPDDNPEKVFVTIRQSLVTRPSEGSLEAAVQRLQSGALNPITDRLLLEEERNLCFFRQIPTSLSRPDNQRVMTPPSAPGFSTSLTPTPALLFRFSALTFNAHAIHIDPEYTKRVYGLAKLLVHGPLTLVLMMKVLEQALARYSSDSAKPPMVVCEVNYKNLAPLFVNEEITICCKKLRDKTPENGGTVPRLESAWSTEAELWQVWIEKKQGAELTMAVRATVEVRSTLTTENYRRFDQDMNSEGAD